MAVALLVRYLWLGIPITSAFAETSPTLLKWYEFSFYESNIYRASE